MKAIGRLLLGFLLLVAVGSLSAQPDTKKIITKDDITFAKVGDEELKLNLAMPTGKGPFPLVVCIHGGGWRAGNRKDLNMLTKKLAENGFVAATVSYRLSDKAQFPAQIHDCKAALRFLRAHAKKYKINPNKVGAIGFSAGGHLVSLMGTADKSNGLEGNGGHPDQSSRVQAVVSFFGPTDFITKSWNEQVEGYFFVPFFGGKYEAKKDLYAKASPLKYVTKDDPPFLFFHGNKDQLVGLHHSEKMTKALNKLNVPAELVVMEGEAHGWGGQKLLQTIDQSIQFFQEKLK